MKVTLINGNARHGSTWHCKEEFIKALKKYGEVEATEFMLPKDMPSFCRGCFSCITKGEDKCPDVGMMRGMMKKNDWNMTDRAHWERQGWLDGKSPLMG
jgi:multimeric flavodoxin WrbA